MNGPPDHRPVIQFQNVSYRLENGLELLHNLTLQVDRGETLVLLGRSGSGKTTTLKLINHLLSPSAGEVLVDGRSIRDWDLIRLRRMIGYVIQEVGLFPHFTVGRNIALALLLGTRIAMMEAGRLVTAQTPDDFVQSTEPMVAAYVHAFGTDLKRGAS